MLEKLMQDADKLLRELFGQYRDQIEQEAIKLRSTIEKTINDICEKIVSKEREKRKLSEDSFKEEIKTIKDRFEKIEKTQKQIQETQKSFSKSLIEFKEAQENMQERLLKEIKETQEASKKDMMSSITSYIKINSNEIRRSFFNFRK